MRGRQKAEESSAFSSIKILANIYLISHLILLNSVEGAPLVEKVVDAGQRDSNRPIRSLPLPPIPSSSHQRPRRFPFPAGKAEEDRGPFDPALAGTGPQGPFFELDLPSSNKDDESEGRKADFLAATVTSPPPAVFSAITSPQDLQNQSELLFGGATSGTTASFSSAEQSSSISQASKIRSHLLVSSQTIRWTPFVAVDGDPGTLVLLVIVFIGIALIACCHILCPVERRNASSSSAASMPHSGASSSSSVSATAASAMAARDANFFAATSCPHHSHCGGGGHSHNHHHHHHSSSPCSHSPRMVRSASGTIIRPPPRYTRSPAPPTESSRRQRRRNGGTASGGDSRGEGKWWNWFTGLLFARRRGGQRERTVSDTSSTCSPPSYREAIAQPKLQGQQQQQLQLHPLSLVSSAAFKLVSSKLSLNNSYTNQQPNQQRPSEVPFPSSVSLSNSHLSPLPLSGRHLPSGPESVLSPQTINEQNQLRQQGRESPDFIVMPSSVGDSAPSSYSSSPSTSTASSSAKSLDEMQNQCASPLPSNSCYLAPSSTCSSSSNGECSNNSACSAAGANPIAPTSGSRLAISGLQMATMPISSSPPPNSSSPSTSRAGTVPPSPSTTTPTPPEAQQTPTGSRSGVFLFGPDLPPPAYDEAAERSGKRRESKRSSTTGQRSPSTRESLNHSNNSQRHRRRRSPAADIQRHESSSRRNANNRSSRRSAVQGEAETECRNNGNNEGSVVEDFEELPPLPPYQTLFNPNSR